jgi:hypothetical protein
MTSGARGRRLFNQLQSSYAGLTRVSINPHKTHFSKRMDCRVKPGNDDL